MSDTYKPTLWACGLSLTIKLIRPKGLTNERQKMSNLEKIEIFKRWFSQSGHWIYPNRAAALITWSTKGIENLPDAPNAVGLYPSIEKWVKG